VVRVQGDQSEEIAVAEGDGADSLTQPEGTHRCDVQVHAIMLTASVWTRSASGEADVLSAQRRLCRALEREHVLAVLQETGWRIRGPRGAAAILGLPPTTIENRMRRLGIVRPGKELPQE
jgi:transcriptional regulator with GAF, ATPase, and Fis domain